MTADLAFPIDNTLWNNDTFKPRHVHAITSRSPLVPPNENPDIELLDQLATYAFIVVRPLDQAAWKVIA